MHERLQAPPPAAPQADTDGDAVLTGAGSPAIQLFRSTPRWLKLFAAPKIIIVLLVFSVSLCLGTLIYVQHANSSIVNRDMQTAVELSEIAARFDHEDGSLYRLMVDEAANGRSLTVAERVRRIRRKLTRIAEDLHADERLLSPADQHRTAQVVSEINKYNDAVEVVSSMLELDFATSVAMLRPFRENADRVLHEVKDIAAAGIKDAHRHADDAAWRTRLLVAFVAVAVLIVAFLSYLWLALASQRGIQLRQEILRRSEAEREALILARTDVLTGLANRRVFGTELSDAIEAAGSDRSGLAIFLIDLDGFKEANDVHGHAAGDAVLKTVADRLRSLFGHGNVIARLGGDEFAVLLRSSNQADTITSLAADAGRSLHDPVTWRGNNILVGASIGISRFPADGSLADALLHAADIAMYHAKRNRKGSVCLFTPAMEAERLERRRLEEELRIGISLGEIRPFYQPIVRFADSELCGFEILARWQHPRLGLLGPASFVKLAESTGQITAITKLLLRQACIDARHLPDNLRLAINISPMQLEEPGLAESLIDIIHAEGIDPTRIEIEITEDAIMDDVVSAERVITTFRNSGLSIALDDFGTGYSSLSNLRRLKFDKIKIDQSFVSTLHNSAESQKLVEAIIGLARSFEMKVTAEGIEDASTATLLARRGCTQGQGYFFGKPTAFEEVRRLIGNADSQAA
ncbi:EAL domain-containing protein [uncultured Sphingomonas sp.]|uniref:putative bifunctional diguanylate cyclase/phosphodiesterase n=1 Tax=uncultured Sphingomonas sp. TaxID=158754 RepID=UPI0025E50C21|nr:EAL domain-containing protein [uncultured Sphingomonas sp.]